MSEDTIDKAAAIGTTAAQDNAIAPADIAPGDAAADSCLTPETPEEERDEEPHGPRVRTVRQALGLTQEKFSARYGIPLGTLRDWEQGRSQPDSPARAYIKIIASNPEWVSQALAGDPDNQIFG